MRYICAFAVVLVHALPRSEPVPQWAVLSEAGCIPAVPFFFISAGYFLRPHDRSGIRVVLNPVRRLLPIYIFWMSAYFLLLEVIPVRNWSFSVRDWLWGGTAYHLWFLPALGFALVLVGVGLRFFGFGLTGAVCAALAGVALVRGAYHGVFDLPGTPSIHTGQLAGPMYVFIGAVLARWPVVVGWRWLAAILALAYASILGEQFFISSWTGEPLNFNHDVLLSVFIMGTAVFLAAMAMPASAAVRGLAVFGQISLGVYAVHLFVLWLLMPYIGNDSPWLTAMLTCLVFALLTMISLSLQRIPFLRWAVR